jgi:hypothetical protein
MDLELVEPVPKQFHDPHRQLVTVRRSVHAQAAGARIERLEALMDGAHEARKLGVDHIDQAQAGGRRVPELGVHAPEEPTENEYLGDQVATGQAARDREAARVS